MLALVGFKKGKMEVEICSHFDIPLQLVRKFPAYVFSWNFLSISSPLHLFSSHIRRHKSLSTGSTALAWEQKIKLCSFSSRFRSHHGEFAGGYRLNFCVCSRWVGRDKSGLALSQTQWLWNPKWPVPKVLSNPHGFSLLESSEGESSSIEFFSTGPAEEETFLNPFLPVSLYLMGSAPTDSYLKKQAATAGIQKL